jgi:SAM-dependent methyltransferase
MTVKRPFVDFYRELEISPVRQDLSDPQKHFARRAALYRHLGIPPHYVRGARVLEFGPGSGHNALYTASLGPARYVLVEQNPKGVGDMCELFFRFDVRNTEIVESLAEDFESDERFALVIAEGMLPYAVGPVELVKKIARFVEPGGVLIVTCVDGPGALDTVARRVIGWRVVPPEMDPRQRVTPLVEFFDEHLRTLPGRSRPTEDWVLDNVVQPFTGSLFSIPDALEALGSDFEAYGASPHFFADWRWYKAIPEEGSQNAFVLSAYHRTILNFIDYRNSLPPHDAALGDLLIQRSNEIYRLMQRRENHGQAMIPQIVRLLGEIENAVEPLAPQTAQALGALRTFLAAPGTPDRSLLRPFVPYFSRGAQYLSLIRNTRSSQ